MNIPGAIVLIGLPLAMAGVLQILRRWTALMALLASGTTLFCGLLVSFTPVREVLPSDTLRIVLEQPLTVLGRVLVVEPVDRLPLTFIFLNAAVLFFIAWRLLPHSNFFPLGLAMVAMLAGALLVKQVVYTALLVEIAVVLAVFPLYEPRGERHGHHARGGGRYLAFVTLALPGLMVTQLLVDLFAIFPNDTQLLRAATLLLGLSFAILLGAVPFQAWLSTVAMAGSPPVVTFLFTVNVGTVWFMLLAYLESYAQWGLPAAFGSLFTMVGLLMMMIGGALAASQRHPGRLVGYATLVDNGAMFLALGTKQVVGIALAVLLLVARPLSLCLMTVGLDGMRSLIRDDDTVNALSGAAWHAPWRVVAFAVGGIAMAGFPLSLSFAAHWGLYRTLSAISMVQAILALVGCAGVMIGVLGVLRVLFTPLPKPAAHLRLKEDPLVLILVILLIGVNLFLGIFPQTVGRIVLEMASRFTFFTS